VLRVASRNHPNLNPAVEYVQSVVGSSPRVGSSQARSELTVILKPWGALYLTLGILLQILFHLSHYLIDSLSVTCTPRFQNNFVSERAIEYLMLNPAVEYVQSVVGSSPRVGSSQAR